MGVSCSRKEDIVEMENKLDKIEMLDPIELDYPVYFGVRGLMKLSQTRKEN